MSAAVEETMGSGVRERQVAAIFTLELRKNFLSTRALPLYLAAAMPVILFLLVVPLKGERFALDEITSAFAFLFQFFTLRLAIFFGCATLFSNLIRAEVMDRSLHYYFLVPVRRELIAIGKYLAGLLGMTMIFCASVVLTLLVMHLGHPLPVIVKSLLSGPGFDSLLSYLATVSLACAGYGALFLVAGMLFKNPLIPSVMVWSWEAITYLLPPVLKKFTIIHYLDALAPVPFTDGVFALLADPVPTSVAVTGLVAWSALLLGIAAYRLRGSEINYGTD